MADYRLTATGRPLTEDEIEAWRTELQEIQHKYGAIVPAGSNVLCDMAKAALHLLAGEAPPKIKIS